MHKSPNMTSLYIDRVDANLFDTSQNLVFVIYQ